MTPLTTWSVDHIGIAVQNLQAGIDLYSASAGTEVTLRETLEAHGVELAFLNTGGSKLELLAPLRADSPLGRFLASRGPGLHHVCYRVDDVASELARLSKAGYMLIDTAPRAGAGGTRVAFLSPKSFLGVLTELCEYPKT